MLPNNTDVRGKDPKALKFLGICAFLGVLFAFLWPGLPLTDSPSYFDFADQRTLLGIPNGMDVLSNLGFLVLGALGFKNIFAHRKSFAANFELLVFGYVLAAAIVGTAIGSAYFHWQPNHQSLVWDRLPMTLGFSSVLGIVIADRFHPKWGFWIFIVLLPLGLLSVLGHSQTWLSLKPYLTLQFGCILFVIFTVLFTKANQVKNSLYSSVIGFYVLAKIFEIYDQAIYSIGGFISGHSLKHVFAAVAIYQLFKIYERRET